MMRVRLKLGALELHVDARWDLGPAPDVYDQEQDEPDEPVIVPPVVDDIEATQEFQAFPAEGVQVQEVDAEAERARQAKLDKERSLWQRDTP